MADTKFRLITRADFDGVVCGTLFNELKMIEDVLFVHPKEMQDGRVPVGKGDISANVPYTPGVHLCFDHHISEFERVGPQDNHIIDPDSPSTARVIYNHYGGRTAFPEISEDLMSEVDRADSAQYRIEDIMAPEGWVLLNFLLDGRTGLTHYRDFTIDNEQLMRDMMTYCRHHTVHEILALPDVAERLEVYNFHEEFVELQLTRCSKVHGNVVVADLRGEKTVYSGNRFMIYAVFPDCNVSITIRPMDSGLIEFAVGKSIINRSSDANLGSILLEYGGGGHRNAGTCRVPPADVDRVMAELVARLQS